MPWYFLYNIFEMHVSQPCVYYADFEYKVSVLR